MLPLKLFLHFLFSTWNSIFFTCLFFATCVTFSLHLMCQDVPGLLYFTLFSCVPCGFEKAKMALYLLCYEVRFYTYFFFKNVWLRGSIKFDRVVQVFCLFVCAFLAFSAPLQPYIPFLQFSDDSFRLYTMWANFLILLTRKYSQKKTLKKLWRKKMYRLNGRWNLWSKINLILLKNDDKTTKAHYG